jgi:hypothetical protein
MMSRDTVCDLCDRVVPGDEVDSRRCAECGGLIRDEHAGEPYGCATHRSSTAPSPNAAS